MIIMPEIQTPVEFINRVASWPVVNSFTSSMVISYGKVKGYNDLVNTTLNRAEQSFLYVAETAKPVITKFERPSKLSNF